MVQDVNFTNPYKTADFLFFYVKEDAKKTDNNVVKVKHFSLIVPLKTRFLGPQKGDLLAPRIRTCVTNPSSSDFLLTLSDPCMLYIFRKLSSASTSLTKN